MTDNRRKSEDMLEGPPQKKVKLEEMPISLTISETASTRGGRRGRKVKKSSEQRALELLEDTRLSAVEPGQVLCRMCGSWIKLFKHTDYAAANWRTHADRCEIRTNWKARLKEEPEELFALPAITTPTVATASVPEKAPSPPPAVDATVSPDPVVVEPPELAQVVPVVEVEAVEEPVAEEASASYKGKGKNTEQRKAAIEADKDALQPEAHRVLCGHCNMWVKLHNTRPYDLYNWTRHSARCRSKGKNKRRQMASVALGPVDAPVQESSTDTTLLTNEVLPDSVPLSSASSATTVVERPAEATPIQMEMVAIKPEQPEPTLSKTIISTPDFQEMGRKKGRNPEERKRALEADPRCGEVQANQVFCLSCHRWIKLYQNVPYVEANWSRHASRCFLKNLTPSPSGTSSASPSPLSAVTTPAPAPVPLAPHPVSATTPALEPITAPLAPLGLTQVIAVQPLPSASVPPTRGKTVQQREADLRNDSRIATVEPHRVHCGICGQWIKLQVQREYDSWNWRKHVSTCEQQANKVKQLVEISMRPQPQPSTSTSADPASTQTATKEVNPFAQYTVDERRQILLDEPRCSDVRPHSVLCNICQRTVGLHALKEYSLPNWYKHVNACESRVAQNLKPRGPRKYSSRMAQVQAQTVQAQTQAAQPAQPDATTAAAAQDTLVSASSGAPPPASEFPPVAFTSVAEKALGNPGQGTLATVPLTAAAINLRKSLENRKQQLEGDSRIAAVEPHRVLCNVCQKWLKLNNDIQYATFNWFKHIGRCETKFKAVAPVSASSVATLVADVTSLASEQVITPKVEQQDPYMFLRSTKARTTPEERAAKLREDNRMTVLEAHRALCGMCNRWIKLQNRIEYDPHNWIAHAQKCEAKQANLQLSPAGLSSVDAVIVDLTALPDGPSDAQMQMHPMVSSVSAPFPVASPIKLEGDPALDVTNEARRRTEESRLAMLLADSRQNGVEPGRVYCRMCASWVRLNMSTGYLPGNWVRHAKRCQDRTKWKPGDADAPPPPTSPDLRRQARARAGELKLAPAPPPIPELVLEPLEGDEIPALGVFGTMELGEIIDGYEPSFSSMSISVKTPDGSSKPDSSRTVVDGNVAPDVGEDNGNQESPGPASASTSAAHLVASHILMRRAHKTTEDRRQLLLTDPLASAVEPDRVLCKLCQRWIQMRKDVSYSPQNWYKHANICKAKNPNVVAAGDSATAPEVTMADVTNMETDESTPMPFNARFCSPSAGVLNSLNASVPSAVMSLKPVEWAPDESRTQSEPVETNDEESEDEYEGEVDAPVLAPKESKPSTPAPVPPSQSAPAPAPTPSPSTSSAPPASVSMDNMPVQLPFQIPMVPAIPSLHRYPHIPPPPLIGPLPYPSAVNYGAIFMEPLSPSRIARISTRPPSTSAGPT